MYQGSDVHFKWSTICALRRARLMDELALLNLSTYGGMDELRNRLFFCDLYRPAIKPLRPRSRACVGINELSPAQASVCDTFEHVL